MAELTNVTEERVKNEVESLNQNNNMKEVKMTTAEIKLQAVEEARQKLIEAKNVLEANKSAEANIKKSAQSMLVRLKLHTLKHLKRWNFQPLK